jgi:hypothetical protein
LSRLHSLQYLQFLHTPACNSFNNAKDGYLFLLQVVARGWLEVLLLGVPSEEGRLAAQLLSRLLLSEACGVELVVKGAAAGLLRR